MIENNTTVVDALSMITVGNLSTIAENVLGLVLVAVFIGMMLMMTSKPKF